MAELQGDVDVLNSSLVGVVDNGAKNLLNFDVWKTVGCANGTIAVSGNSVTVTATANDAYTRYQATGDASIDFPVNARILVKQGDVLTFSWNYVANNSQTNDQVYLFGNGVASKSVTVGSQTKELSYTVPSDVTFITFRVGVGTSGNSATYSNLMICTKSQFDISPTYEPYALGNQVLTPALIEQVDEGAKNIIKMKDATGTGGTATLQSDGYTVKLTGSSTASTSLAFGSGTAPSTGTYKFVVKASGTMDRIYIWDNTASASVESLYNTGVKDVQLIAGHTYAVSHYAGSAITLDATVSAMICSAADYGVSQNFVPYRPNWDLVVSSIPVQMRLDNGSSNHSSQTFDVTSVPHGMYFLVTYGADSASVRYGSCVYVMIKRSDNSIQVSTVNETITESKINSITVSGTTATIAYAGQRYHTTNITSIFLT